MSTPTTRRARTLTGFAATALLASLLAANGCVQVVDPIAPVNPCDPECLAERGWTAYESGDWSQSSFFIQALTIDPTFAEGYMGIAYFHIEQGLVAQASAEFQAALNFDSTLVAAYAGNAFCLGSLGDDGGAIYMAQTAIDKGGPDYVFEHKDAVSATNLRLFLAQTYFRIGDYASAQLQVDVLAPGNGLFPEAPGYVSDLLALIEILGALE